MPQLKPIKLKPRILFIIHLPPPVHGASLISTFIQKSKLINSQFNCDFINLATSKHLEEIGKGKWSKGATFFKLFWEVTKNIYLHNYDLCFITLTAKPPGFYKDFIIILLLKLFRIKRVFLFNNKGVTLSSKNILNNYLYRIALKNTPCIQNSKYLYNDIEKYVEKQNVYFLPNGIPEIVHLKENSNYQSELPCSLLFLSNMMVEKGICVLIEAGKLLKDRGINFQCHFVGAWADFTQSDFDEAVTHNNLESHLFSHGRKYGEDKFKFYAEADIFVFPTFYHNECFPLVLLEAMQFGLPIISTREGGIPDIIKDSKTGYIVRRQNPVDLADKLQLLIENNEIRTQMGLSARKRYDKFFRLEKFEKNLADILNTVIE